MMQRPLTRAILATVALAAGAAGLALAAQEAGKPTVAAAPTPAAALAPPAAGAAPMVSAPTPAAPTAAPATEAGGTPSAPAAHAAAPAPVPGADAGIEARRTEYEERLDAMRRRDAATARRGGPEGIPSRADLDRYVEQRRQEVDAQLRATDPWGQARRDWMEGRRQFRRDSLDMFRGAPAGPGAYPWGPLAPYYGMPSTGPVAPLPPARQGMDELFAKKHRAIEEQFRQAPRWTPYGTAGQPERDTGQEWMLRQNPWAPVP